MRRLLDLRPSTGLERGDMNVAMSTRRRPSRGDNVNELDSLFETCFSFIGIEDIVPFNLVYNTNSLSSFTEAKGYLSYISCNSLHCLFN